MPNSMIDTARIRWALPHQASARLLKFCAQAKNSSRPSMTSTCIVTRNSVLTSRSMTTNRAGAAMLPHGSHRLRAANVKAVKARARATYCASTVSKTFVARAISPIGCDSARKPMAVGLGPRPDVLKRHRFGGLNANEVRNHELDRTPRGGCAPSSTASAAFFRRRCTTAISARIAERLGFEAMMFAGSVGSFSVLARARPLRADAHRVRRAGLSHQPRRHRCRSASMPITATATRCQRQAHGRGAGDRGRLRR